MLSILYLVEDFPPKHSPVVIGEGILATPMPAHVWAAISVGKRQLSHLTLHGLYSLFEMAYRGAMIFANLREGADGNILRSSAYEGLDPSEKGAISYFIGVILAKLFCGYPYHNERLRQKAMDESKHEAHGKVVRLVSPLKVA